MLENMPRMQRPGLDLGTTLTEEQDTNMRIAFDIGGVLSKYPAIFRPLIHVLRMAELEDFYDHTVEVYIITDMKPHEKAVSHCRTNNIDVPDHRIFSADYETHGELCKAILCKELGIDLLIDDFPGYVSIGKHVRLLVMPEPHEPYYHDDWKTDGSEGTYGRRVRPTKGDHPWG